METFGFEYETSLTHYEYDFLAFDRALLTTRSSAILVVNRTATRYDPTTIWRIPVTNLISSYQKVVS